jgi:hypothetical protein
VSVENIGEITEAIDFFAAMNLTEFVMWNKGANQYAASRRDMDVLKEQYDAMFL